MVDDSLSTPRIQHTGFEANKAQQAALQRAALGMVIAQEEISEDYSAWVDGDTFNPTLMARRFETLELKAKKRPKEEEAEKAEKEEKVLEIQQVEEILEQYAKENPESELQTRTLLLLRSRLSNNDSKEDILRKVLESYADYSLADEALDFLTRTTQGELGEKVRQAREDLNTAHGREIRAGKNISQQAREFSKEGLGTPTSLRDLYRDITGNPREPQSLFAELSNQFDFEKMKGVINFILHSLGSDLKAKGPSIDRSELHRLMSEGKTMQAILGVYSFFKSRMALIFKAFQKQGIRLPHRLTFELLAKLLVKFLQERYPSPDKVLQMAQYLGLLEELLGQIVIYTQMRDAIRHIAPRLFKSEQHRQDVLSTLIDAIEELDDQLDEEEEKKEEEEEKEEKKEDDQKEDSKE